MMACSSPHLLESGQTSVGRVGTSLVEQNRNFLEHLPDFFRICLKRFNSGVLYGVKTLPKGHRGYENLEFPIQLKFLPR